MTTPQLLKLIDDTILELNIACVVEAYNAWDAQRRQLIAQHCSATTRPA